MGEEEYVDTIMDIDSLLMQVQSDMQINNNAKALFRIREARSMIAEMHESENDLYALNLIK
jgi:hypothetical protein